MPYLTKRFSAGIVVTVVVFASIAIAVGLSSDTTTQADEPPGEPPAKVEPLKGTDLHRVILTERASQRLGLKTVQVRHEQIDGAERIVIPYASVLYDPTGATWAYISAESLVFQRHPIQIDYIEGDRAVLKSGPPVGAAIVTAGAIELYGAEFGVGH